MTWRDHLAGDCVRQAIYLPYGACLAAMLQDNHFRLGLGCRHGRTAYLAVSTALAANCGAARDES